MPLSDFAAKTASKGGVFRKRLLVLLVSIMAVLFIAGSLAFVSILRLQSYAEQVTKTLDLRDSATKVLDNAQDAETSQRGFLITQNEVYLAPFESAQADIEANLKNLVDLTAGNSEQRARVGAVAADIATKLAELRRTVTLAKENRIDEALAVVKTDKGRRSMDAIRASLAAITQVEVDALAKQRDIARQERRFLGVLIIVMVLATFGAALTIWVTTRSFVTGLATETKTRQEAEATLRQVQKMEAVGQLSGGIAHDFNNLLTIIIGNIDTLKRRIANATKDQDAAHLAATLAKPIDMAMQGARSAAQLTQRLLAFSRQQPLNPSRIDANHLVAGVSELLRRTVGEAVAVETVLAGGLWPAFVDPHQLESALVNLVINARDAMPDGGRITIETANAYLDDAYAARFGDIAAGQYVMLSVSDTGHGMARDVLDRAFEPFFTTKDTGKGTGLGLAMVHGFVKQSGGHVRIYSEVGVGTTVKLYLRRLTQADGAATAPAERAPELTDGVRAKAGETILFVEDNAAVREYGVAALEDLGFRIIEAGDAEAALKAFAEADRIDLLFTDVVLPGGVNGRKLAEQILEKRPGLPVLYTTGYTRNAIVHNGQLDADVLLLNKPYTQQELTRKIRELLDSKGS
jgi:signal transduction histidine kinase